MSKSFLYQLAASRKIACYKIGQGAIRFRLDDLLTYLEECRVEPEKQTSRGIRPTGPTFHHLHASASGGLAAEAGRVMRSTAFWRCRCSPAK